MNTQCVSKPVIKKGDMVQVISGREKGKTGKILRVVENRAVIIEKLNMVKRHTKPTQQNQTGGLIDKEAPLNLSKVLLYCPKCTKGVRVGKKIDGKKKSRVCKKCGQVL